MSNDDETTIAKVDENDHVELWTPIEKGMFQETGVMRFDFQRGAVHASKGFVINAGANEDPAGLKQLGGSRVINTDLMAFDTGMNRANVVDTIMDITKPWEDFADNSAEMVVFGDVLEHLGPEPMRFALSEAHRVAPRLCITIPEDWRVDQSKQYVEGIYNEHCIIATEELMRSQLAQTNWKPFAWIICEWGFNDNAGRPVSGHCIEAHRI